MTQPATTPSGADYHERRTTVVEVTDAVLQGSAAQASGAARGDA